jgi:hypothetical protein
VSSLKIRNIDFVWLGRLARGKHTCIAGEGGLGKSRFGRGRDLPSVLDDGEKVIEALAQF